MTSPGSRAPRLGVVTSFDLARGIGTVSDDAGTCWPFHCTALADGTRSVEVGAHVAFSVVPGHLGRTEAVALTRLAPAAGGGGLLGS